jgi:anti-sigma regulatory factor (Ser/Thr protein kinase)
MTGTGPGPIAPAFPTHRALVYRGVDEFVTLTARVIHGALAAGQPVLAALPTAHLHLVREALQSDGADVRWLDMAAEGRNPGRILPAVLTAFDDEHPGETVTMIGEPIWPGRNANEYAAAVAHEALINLAFAGRDLSVVCPYDAAGLTAGAMHDAHRTHPEILDRRGTRTSDDYGDPAAVAAEATARLSDPSPEAVVLQVNHVDEVRPAREVLRNEATRLGLVEDRVDRFVLACHEAIANALKHGGGRAEVRLWRDGGELVCQVDSAGGFDDVLAGRRRPPPDSSGGRGLVMVNELCDLVLLRATPRGATIQMRTATAAA